MPQHTQAHMDTFVKVFEISLEQSNLIFDKSMKNYNEQMAASNEASL
jgi:hypothetical protein